MSLIFDQNLDTYEINNVEHFAGKIRSKSKFFKKIRNLKKNSKFFKEIQNFGGGFRDLVSNYS